MRWLAALCAAITLLAPARARAGSRLGVIDLPPDLEHALRVALEPWGVSIEPVDGPPPQGKGAAAITEADAVAGTASVSALLWVTDDGGGSLWIYDVASAELSLRHVPPVRDAADAAALALSAKSMLETTVMAPPAERFGATVIESDTEALVPGTPLVRATTPPPRWRVHTQLGVRAIDGAAEPRLGVAVSWWPRARLGVELGALTGPGIALSDPAVVARYTDNVLGAAARARLPLRRALTLDGGAGLSLHATALDGFAPARDASIQVSRVDAALDLDALVAIELGARTELAIGAAAGIALRRQRYLADGMTVFELPAVELRGLAELRVSLP